MGQKNFSPQVDSLETKIVLSSSSSSFISDPTYNIPVDVRTYAPLVNPDINPRMAEVIREIYAEIEAQRQKDEQAIREALAPMPPPVHSPPSYTEPFYEDPVRSPYFFP